MRPEEITSIIKKNIENFDAKVQIDEIGSVITVGDGIVRAHGLNNVMAAEFVEFESGSMGMVLNLEENNVGIALLNEDHDVIEGSIVKRTGKIVEIPVGDELLGRVVNSIGQPIDDMGAINASNFRAIEVKAPGIIERQPVCEPL